MAGDWEDQKSAVTLHDKAKLAHRQCPGCRRISFVEPYARCRHCGGVCNLRVNWKTMLAPTVGGSMETYELPG